MGEKGDRYGAKFGRPRAEQFSIAEMPMQPQTQARVGTEDIALVWLERVPWYWARSWQAWAVVWKDFAWMREFQGSAMW